MTHLHRLAIIFLLGFFLGLLILGWPPSLAAQNAASHKVYNYIPRRYILIPAGVRG